LDLFDLSKHLISYSHVWIYLEHILATIEGFDSREWQGRVIRVIMASDSDSDVQEVPLSASMRVPATSQELGENRPNFKRASYCSLLDIVMHRHLGL